MRYDETELRQRLETLPARARAVFAVSCVIEHLRSYDEYHRKANRGDPAVVRGALERLLADLDGTEINRRELEADLERVMAVIPREDDEPWFEEQAYAEDVAAALAYAIRARLTGSSQEAAWAARRCYELADHAAINELEEEGNESPDEETILHHRRVQAELERQAQKLSAIENVGETAVLRAVTEEYRART